MSTVVVNINDDKLSALKKFVQQANAKMRVITDEEDIMQKLVEEGLKSKTSSVSLLKSQLKKMLLQVKGSFNRDFKKIQNRSLSKAVLIRINEMEKAENVLQISHFKKLRKYNNTYKTEIVSGAKIYWMLCYIYKNEIYLVRIKSESYFKKYLR